MDPNESIRSGLALPIIIPICKTKSYPLSSLFAIQSFLRISNTIISYNSDTTQRKKKEMKKNHLPLTNITNVKAKFSKRDKLSVLIC